MLLASGGYRHRRRLYHERERLVRVQATVITVPERADSGNSSIVVNIEWTINGAAPPLRKLGFINTWDIEPDRNCETPGFQPFEYVQAAVPRRARSIGLIQISNYITVSGAG